MKITSRTGTIGLIGHPIAHSRSPQIQNAVLREYRLPYVYLAYDVHPDQLSTAVKGMKTLGFTGWNVTIPHKVEIMKELDELDQSANQIGAVNTVVREGSKWVGYNTDGQGYLRSLQEETAINLKGKKVVLLGAGGAARAVGYSLATAGVRELVIANRTLAKAEQLASELSTWTQVDVQPINDCRQAIMTASVLVNTTSVGMSPYVEALPISADWLHSDLVVSDLIYIPRQTALLKAAAQVGATTHNGMGMLVHQAAIALELWLSIEAPTSLMRNILDQSLQK